MGCRFLSGGSVLRFLHIMFMYCTFLKDVGQLTAETLDTTFDFSFYFLNLRNVPEGLSKRDTHLLKSLKQLTQAGFRGILQPWDSLQTLETLPAAWRTWPLCCSFKRRTEMNSGKNGISTNTKTLNICVFMSECVCMHCVLCLSLMYFHICFYFSMIML